MSFAKDILQGQKDHQKRIEECIARIYNYFIKAQNDYVKLASKSDYDGSEPVIFAFENNKTIKKQAENIVNNLFQSVNMTISTQIKNEWHYANGVYDDAISTLFLSVGIKNINKLKNSEFVRYFNNHFGALKAFMDRSIAGLSLSQKVWNVTSNFQKEMEMAISISIEKGQSAQQLSRAVRPYLNYPDKLFRRVRDKFGELQFSKSAKKFHPTAGVYRSSYKNAMRLARTEINMSYRIAEQSRYNDLDFVVGYEVKRSYTPYSCELCDALAGKYPKDFEFAGWHPQCRCFVIPILNTKEEFEKQSDDILAGKSPSINSVNSVKNLPQGFIKWVNENKQRINEAKSRGTLPYFLKDNMEIINFSQ